MEKIFTPMPVAIHRRLPLAANPVGIVTLPDGGYLLNFASQPHVVKLDAELQEVWRKDLQAHTIDYVPCVMTASKDGSKFALSGYTDVRIFDANGNLLRAFAHEPWGHFQGSSCHFSADGRFVWLISPDENDVLYVIRLDDFSVAATYVMEDDGAYNYTFHDTPDDNQLLIAAAAGQDDALLYLAALHGDQIIITELSQCRDRIFGSFSPDGQEFVTAPHYGEGMELFSFPELNRIAQLEQAELFEGRDEYPSEEDEDSLDYTVLHASNDTLLAFTRFGRLLLIDRQTLSCTGELTPEGCTIQAYDLHGRPTTDPAAVIDYAGEIITVRCNGQRQLLITHNTGELRLYNLPDEL